MFGLENLKIDLLGMKGDSFEYSCVLSDEYFQSLDDAEINSGEVNTVLSIRKAATGGFALKLAVEGNVTVQCDLCLDDMLQPVKGESSFVVKLGDEKQEADDDVIVVSEKDGLLDTLWLIYETIALAIPIKHVHAPGKCNDAMTKKLEELSATRSGDGVAEGEIDSRWAELLKLKNKK